MGVMWVDCGVVWLRRDFTAFRSIGTLPPPQRSAPWIHPPTPLPMPSPTPLRPKHAACMHTSPGSGL